MGFCGIARDFVRFPGIAWDFLTERETEVLELICKQYKTAEIAQKLFISPRTVEVHRKNLLEKTDVKNVAGLVIFAIKNELVPPIIIE